MEPFAEPRFRAVLDAFNSNFAARLECGAGLALYHKGELVVSVWAGNMHGTKNCLWRHDTLAPVYSVTKGLVSGIVHLLFERRALSLDSPVSLFWPDFAANGKEIITVRHLLSHQAGLPALRETVASEDYWNHDKMASLLAAQEPYWRIGEGHGYHPVTWGWLVGELLKRIDGRTVGALWRDEIGAVADLDAWISVPAELEHRVAVLVPPVGSTSPFDQLLLQRDSSMAARAFCNPLLPSTSSRSWREHENAATSGHVTALALAKYYAILERNWNDKPLQGLRLWSSESLRRASQAQTAGIDKVLPPAGFGPWKPNRIASGWMLPSDMMPFAPSSFAFGHGGAGGAIGFADPTQEISLGYVPNQMHPRGSDGLDPRWKRIVDAVYACLDKSPFGQE